MKHMFPSSHQLQSGKFFPWMETTKRFSCLAVKRLDRLHSHTALTQGLSPFPSSASLQMVSWYWVFSFSSFVRSPYTCLYTFAHKLKLVMELPWSNFNLLCGCCTLLPFSSTLTSLCTPVCIPSSFKGCLYNVGSKPTPRVPCCLNWVSNGSQN